jgi:hypothetical protein
VLVALCVASLTTEKAPLQLIDDTKSPMNTMFGRFNKSRSLNQNIKTRKSSVTQENNKFSQVIQKSVTTIKR